MVTGIARADIQRNVLLNFAGYGLPLVAAWLIRVTISLIIQTWLAHRFVLSPHAVSRVAV